MKHKLGVAVMLCALLATPALGAVRFISDTFSGDEPVLGPNPASCSDVPKPYVEVGTFQVSLNEEYLVADGGNNAFTITDAPVADVVILLYDGAFDSGNPELNRIAVIDELAGVNLETGKSYVLVVQYWCDREEYGQAPFAIVIDGEGLVSGLGFDAPSYAIGEFDGNSPTAFFTELGGDHAYFASAPINVPRTGNYFFADVVGQLGSEVQLWVYEDSFNPDFTSVNFVGRTVFAQSIFLEAGKTYVFVAIDQFDFLDFWRFVLFPPADPVFNPGYNGAWVIDGIGGQGILAEILPNNGIMFFAWFTYIDSPPVVASVRSQVQAQDAGGGTQPETHLGSTDQRWLTGFGFLPASGNTMNINFENSTGGSFDSTVFNPTTDSDYGIGTVQLLDCNSLNLSYNLPGGLADTVLFERILPDGASRCYDLTPNAPLQPAIQ
ncbi:MAG: hypothetical protein HKO64_08965 [Xanthomonadales bacterium]|nr:hypothetical protein [Gammaproteobacteria bacterium]NNL95737.1 hypothetical protein [Xanthomonadales bacterium]